LAFAGFGCSKTPTPVSEPNGGNAPTSSDSMEMTDKNEVDVVVDEIIDEADRADQSTDPTGDIEYLDDDEGTVGDYMITSYETE